MNGCGVQIIRQALEPVVGLGQMTSTGMSIQPWARYNEKISVSCNARVSVVYQKTNHFEL